MVSPYSLSVPGGVQGQVLGLARALRAAGHQARVLGPSDGPPPETGVVALGACLPTSTNGSVAPIAPDPSCVLRTVRALQDEAFDIVHLHEPIAPGPTLTSLVCSSAPTVGTFHAAGTSGVYRWLRPIAVHVARRLAQRCAVSADARDLARHYLGGTYEILFNGIEVDRYAKAPPWPTEGPTALFLSRHEPRKGLEVALGALDALGPETRLWVASQGPETARLRARTAGDGRVEWLGRISEEEKRSRIRGADVVVAPSLHGESFGLILLEAMAASTPVVASDLDGYRNVARDGREALLVPPGDARALAEGIRRVLTDPALRAELVAGGEQRAAEMSMDRLSEHYVEIYGNVLSRA